MAPRTLPTSAQTSPSRATPALPDPAALWRAFTDPLGLGPDHGLVRDLVRPVAWLGSQLLLILAPSLTLLGLGATGGRLAGYLADLDAPRTLAPAPEEPCPR